MKNLPSNLIVHGIAALGLAVTFVPLRPAGAEEPRAKRYFVETGVPTTGLNRSLGVPVWTFPNLAPLVDITGDPNVQLFGFDTLGEFDAEVGSGNGNSRPLTPNSSPDAVLASYLDAAGLGALGVDVASFPSRVLNIPIDETPILDDEFGVHRVNSTCANETENPKAVTRAGPCGNPTLKDWMRARGRSTIVCRDDGTSRLRVRAWNLKPNRMYTLWYVTADFEAADPRFLFKAIPFGGVPNLEVSDVRGSLSIRRELGFCPHEQPEALGYVLVERGNGQNYGGVPAPFLNATDPDTAFVGYDGLVPGSVAFVQLSFNINGKPFAAK